MTIQRMDHVGIVVDDLAAAIDFLRRDRARTQGRPAGWTATKTAVGSATSAAYEELVAREDGRIASDRLADLAARRRPGRRHESSARSRCCRYRRSGRLRVRRAASA
jgi:catechol 2,3-dioxygenase-like lactoylglutathione lyase family enzyme